MRVISKLLVGAMVAGGLLNGSGASANVLYDNVPINNYDVDAWTINFGYALSNSFTLSSDATVTGMNFTTWNSPGDDLSSVSWAITTTPFGPALFSGSASASDSLIEASNPDGYAIYNNTISLGVDPLSAGTYYIELISASVSSGNPIFWDQGDGPSAAYHNQIGPLANCAAMGDPGGPTCSETFQILGITSSPIPEPGAWSLMLVGLGGLGTAIRSRRKATSAA